MSDLINYIIEYIGMYTFSRAKFDKAGIVLHKTSLLQMSKQRCILEQMFSNAIATSLVAQFVLQHVML